MEEKTQREKRDFSRLILGKPLMALDLPVNQRYTITKDQIKAALESKDAVTLRKFSQYFYHTSGEYRRLVSYFGNILTNNFIIIPKVDPKIYEDFAFNKAFKLILKYSNDADIQQTCSEIGNILVRDGAFFGYERLMNDNTISLQQLPTIYCRSRFKVNGVYAIEFDFSFFDGYTNSKISYGDTTTLEEMLNSFPEDFKTMYTLYLQNKVENKWQMLDTSYARAHMLIDSIPMLSSIFIDLLELENYKLIDRTRSALSIYKLIIQKLPIDDNGEISLLMEEILELHNNAKNMIGNSYVNVMTTPCEVDALNLDENKYLIDDIEKGSNLVYNSAGTPIALFNTNSKTGSIGLNLSVKVDESVMLPILLQYEKWYQNKFSMISPRIEFGIIFPPNTIFNKKEQFDLYKEAASLGFPTRLLTLAALGIKQTDANFLLDYENLLLDLPKRMIPVVSSFNTSIDEDQGGAPISSNPLTPEGEKTRDQEKNKNRA